MPAENKVSLLDFATITFPPNSHKKTGTVRYCGCEQSHSRGFRIFKKFVFEFEIANIRRIQILETGINFVELNSDSNFTSAANSNSNSNLTLTTSSNWNSNLTSATNSNRFFSRTIFSNILEYLFMIMLTYGSLNLSAMKTLSRHTSLFV